MEKDISVGTPKLMHVVQGGKAKGERCTLATHEVR